MLDGVQVFQRQHLMYRYRVDVRGGVQNSRAGPQIYQKFKTILKIFIEIHINTIIYNAFSKNRQATQKIMKVYIIRSNLK